MSGGVAAPFPEVLHPPEGYGLVQAGLYKAGNNFTPANIMFLQKLGLKTVINMGPGMLTTRSTLGSWLAKEGIAVENPCGDYPGDYDVGEEAVKGALELLLDHELYPILLVCSAGSHLCSRLIGCLRRLQHWSMTAILDEYRSATATANTYDMNERFMERFDLDLVVFPPRDQQPPWFAAHLDMMDEERRAEAASAAAFASGRDGAGGSSSGGDGGGGSGGSAAIPAYRLNSFVYTTPLVSSASAYNAKRWLLDVDDDD